MALKKCKECGKEVSSKAEKCPHCGARVKRKPLGCGGLILAIIILGCFGYIINNITDKKTTTPTKSISTSEKKKDWRKQDNSTMAYIMMKGFVKKSLKSPKSAEFPGIFGDRSGHHVKYLGNQKYRIVSWVDAQNTFGATLRNNFIGIIKQTKDDYWVLEELEFIKR